MDRVLNLITPANGRDFIIKSLILAIIYVVCDVAVHAFVSMQFEQSFVADRITTFLIALPFALFVMWIMSIQRRLKEELKSHLQTDPLTGLASRAHFLDVAERQIANGGTAAALMIDLDHFKSVNDTYGHYFGDLTLRQVAEHMLHSVRETDIVGRIGGEEFIVLLPDTPLETARLIAHRLCQPVHVRSTEANGIDEISIDVTMSVGGVMALPGDTLLDVMNNADEAMYQAKHTGRARVVFRDMRPPQFAIAS